MLFFWRRFGLHFCDFRGHVEGQFWLKNAQQINLNIEQKRDPGRRGPRKLEHGHLGVVYHAPGRIIQYPVLPMDHGL